MEIRKYVEQMTALDFEVVQCSWCKQYFDSVTQKRVEKPPDQSLFSHMICGDCYKLMMVDLNSEEGA